MVSIWNDFGSRESPYATESVPPTEAGEALLVYATANRPSELAPENQDAARAEPATSGLSFRA
jgi:hypothetical protein